MAKDWAVTFYNVETKAVKVDCFTEKTHQAAIAAFRACYRHGVYKILSVVEIPHADQAATTEPAALIIKVADDDQAATLEMKQQPCCPNPAKPAHALPELDCPESVCCALCPDPCNSRQPCRRDHAATTEPGPKPAA